MRARDFDLCHWAVRQAIQALWILEAVDRQHDLHLGEGVRRQVRELLTALDLASTPQPYDPEPPLWDDGPGLEPWQRGAR